MDESYEIINSCGNCNHCVELIETNEECLRAVLMCNLDNSWNGEKIIVYESQLKNRVAINGICDYYKNPSRWDD